MSAARSEAPQDELLAWYARHRRDLPWRRTRDPYRILVSEVMLQQTQVDRVIPYYERFLAHFPDESALAAAHREELQRCWKGLGYPSRADRLQAACRVVLEEYRGEWPDTAEGLQALPGIGPYTAGAVACFAFARAVPLVDTNVARVYARRDGLEASDKKLLWAHAANEVSHADPIGYNNALMELGALVCTARAAHCLVCPWQRRCQGVGDEARQQATANPLKVASAKKRYGEIITDRRKPRQHIVLALIHDDVGRYLVAKRPADKHVGGCWELPGGKREKGEDDRTALAREVHEELGVELMAARPFVTYSHDYGDRYLTFHCYRCRLFDVGAVRPLASEGLAWVTPSEFMDLTFPPANRCVLERMRDYHRLG